jgi:hypothetical protein
MAGVCGSPRSVGPWPGNFWCRVIMENSRPVLVMALWDLARRQMRVRSAIQGGQASEVEFRCTSTVGLIL